MNDHDGTRCCVSNRLKNDHCWPAIYLPATT